MKVGEAGVKESIYAVMMYFSCGLLLILRRPVLLYVRVKGLCKHALYSCLLGDREGGRSRSEVVRVLSGAD